MVLCWEKVGKGSELRPLFHLLIGKELFFFIEESIHPFLLVEIMGSNPFVDPSCSFPLKRKTAYLYIYRPVVVLWLLFHDYQPFTNILTVLMNFFAVASCFGGCQKSSFDHSFRLTVLFFS